MEDDAKNYIFKDCLISEALRSNTHSPGLPSNGLYYDVVGSSSHNANSSYLRGSLDFDLDYSLPPTSVHNYLVADQTSTTSKSRTLVDTNVFFDLNDYKPIFDSSPDIEIDGDTDDDRTKLFIGGGTSTTTTVDHDQQNRQIGLSSSFDENRSRYNRSRQILIDNRDDNGDDDDDKILDTKPPIRSYKEEVVITDDGQYFDGEYILGNDSSSLTAPRNYPFVTDNVVVVTAAAADQSNSGSSIYDEPCLTSSSSVSNNDGDELWSAAGGDDYSSSSPPTPAPPPLSYVCTVRTEKNLNHHFNLNKFAFNNVNGSYDSSLLLTSVSALNKHRSKMQDLALRHRLITNQNIKGCGQLILSPEERRTLIQEGYSIPKTLPLTKKEEEALKLVRRKIKNKLSAQESRRRRKEYIDTLERKLRHCQTENDNLRSRLETLEKNNADLINQVKTLKGDTTTTTINDNKSVAVVADRHRQQILSSQGPHSGGVTLTALFLLFAVLIPSIPVWSGLNFFGCMIRFPVTSLDNGSGSIFFDKGESYSPNRNGIFDEESTILVKNNLPIKNPETTSTNSHSRLLQSDYLENNNEYHDFPFVAQFLGQFKTVCPLEVLKKSDEISDSDFSTTTTTPADKENNFSSKNEENTSQMRVNLIQNDLILVKL